MIALARVIAHSTVTLTGLLTSFGLAPRGYADLLAYYDFNDASAPETAVDITGQGNDGELFLAEFSDDGLGRTGQAGDRAMDFGEDGDGANMTIPSAFDGAFSTIEENDAATVTLWVFGGESQPQDGFVFWFEPGRQLSATIPWSNGGVYFDVAGCCAESQRIVRNVEDDAEFRDEWAHYAFVKNGETTEIYQNGELWHDSADAIIDPLGDIEEVIIGAGAPLVGPDLERQWSYNGLIDELGIWDEALTDAQIQDVMVNGVSSDAAPKLQPGDADQDLDFDQLDLVKVQIAAKYLSGTAATWGEGDWDAAPGGKQGEPPAGDGFFNQLDIISALGADKYLAGPYAAITTGGEVTIGGRFGSIGFVTLPPAGASESELAADLSTVGSPAGGGDIGDVDLIYVPEPNGVIAMLIGVAVLLLRRRSSTGKDV